MVKKKSLRVIWDDDARLYFKAAILYIKRESPQGAEKVKKEIFETIDLIRDNPLVFEADKLKGNNNGSYRAFIVYHYRVTYKITTDTLLILRVRHTSQEPLGH